MKLQQFSAPVYASPMEKGEFSAPTRARIGIIGGGFAALMAYVVFRFRGIPAEDIRVFSSDASPEQSWEKFVRAIRQTHMRSESIGHFFPTDSPGLATIEAWRGWSIKPLLLAWFDRYHPSVHAFLEHTRAMARQTGFYRAIVPAMVTDVHRVDGGFVLTDEEGREIGAAQHLILAVGHGVPDVPAAVTSYRDARGADGRVTHAFEEKSYAPPQTALVLGDGLTAAHEWMNVLSAGGSVVALSETDFSFGQHLNTPRKYFSSRGFVPYRSRADDDRLRELRQATRGTIPRYGYWMRVFHHAERAGRLQYACGHCVDIKEEDGALRCIMRLPGGLAFRTIRVGRVIAATGFQPVTTHPLLHRLVEKYGLETVGSALRVRDDFTIAELTDPAATVAVIGPAAAWALPCADSLGGMKIVAHTLANRLVGPETWRPMHLFAKTWRWASLIAGRELA